KTGTPNAQTEGTAFNVTVNAVDTYWNVVDAAADTFGLNAPDTYAALPDIPALVSGTKSLSLTLKTAGSATLTASDLTDTNKPASVSPSITLNAGAFAKLQILAPGESASPGTATGKLGTPAAQTAGTAFSVSVNAVDANWNLISTNDTVAITSSDTNAALPSNAALVAGTKSLSVTLKTAGSSTLTASNVTH